MPQISFHFKEVFGNKYCQFSIIYGNGDLANMEEDNSEAILYLHLCNSF